MEKKTLQAWADRASRNGVGAYVRSGSIHIKHKVLYFLTSGLDKEYFAIMTSGSLPKEIEGIEIISGNYKFCFSDLSGANAAYLRSVFTGLAPSAGGRDCSSFGVGDRLGIASTGHLRVFARTQMVPVLAQQSLRELELTGRSYRDVIDAATWAVFRTGYQGRWIADGDHLKHFNDAVSALRQGCTMITADLSEHINYRYAGASAETLDQGYAGLNRAYRNEIEACYLDKTIGAGEELSLHFTKEVFEETVLVYHEAVDHAEALFRVCRETGFHFDFEVSIDETEAPTTPEAHYFVADQLQRRGVAYTSIAPRFVGEFQKGIDYIGELEEFEADFKKHASIAAFFGYKLSVHSASDKFSVYPVMARLKQGPVHIKTSGTNWLVALEVVAQVDPELFRALFRHAYEVFPLASSYYHVTPDLSKRSDIAALPDTELPSVLGNRNDRQVLHIAYGEILKVESLRERLFSRLEEHIEEYWHALETHIGRHVSLLGLMRD